MCDKKKKEKNNEFNFPRIATLVLVIYATAQSDNL